MLRRIVTIVIEFCLIASALPAPTPVTAAPTQEPVTVFFNDLTGFDAAAGSPPIVVNFDDIPTNTDVTGTTISGITFDLSNDATSAPLVVVAGNDTFTPSGFIDPETNKLFPTSGTNVLSPGGPELAPGPNSSLEDDSLQLIFGFPAIAVGFDILFQQLDADSFVGITVLDSDGAVLFSQSPIPTGSSVSTGPGGAVFVGFVSDEANIAKVVIDEQDDNNNFPDANIGYDSFRVQDISTPPLAPNENLQSPPPNEQAVGEDVTAEGCPLTNIGASCLSVADYPNVEPNSLAYGSGAVVYPHSGDFLVSEVDLEIAGRGFNWRFERRYRSGISTDGPLGHNWDFDHGRRLVVDSETGNVARLDGLGRTDVYFRNSDGSYLAPTGFYSSLTQNPDGSFRELDLRGTVVTYAPPDNQGIALMTTLSDRHGNTMSFLYDTQGRLEQVIDTLGRPITYQYKPDGHLDYIEDFIDRRVTFSYDEIGDLLAVTSPAVTGTPNGNDFPNGKTTRYAYSSGFADDRLNHNLIAITAPNEVARDGPPRVQVIYDDQDRVISFTSGGNNASGVPAGGSVTYAYRNEPKRETTVIDSNGNQTIYHFNRLGNIVSLKQYTNRDIRKVEPESYETRYEYNVDGLLVRQIHPEGNSVEYVYNTSNPDRLQQSNLIAEIRHADADRGADQTFLMTAYTYEPIYNQVRSITEARGNDPSFVPQNGGEWSAVRYTKVYTFDYEESCDFEAISADVGGRTPAEVQQLLTMAGMCAVPLGDVNGDEITNQVAGEVIRVQAPTVSLLPESNQAVVEGDTTQEIVELFAYDHFGQRVYQIDQEGNVTDYAYWPENDPDGDGALTPDPPDGRTLDDTTGGYLKTVTSDGREIVGPGIPVRRNGPTCPEDLDSNSRVDTAGLQAGGEPCIGFASIRTQYFFDPVGNTVQVIDGRGVATQYQVNQLNQVVEIVLAVDVGQARSNPEEPNWAACTDATLVECQAGMVAFGYRTRLHYDHNDNVIKSEVENRDSNNQELAGDWIETGFDYDILDNLITQTQEVNTDIIVLWTYRYDRNGNRVLEISPVAKLPEGHPERQESNAVSYVFDERDLLFTATNGGLTEQFRTLAAYADIPEREMIPNSADISTVRYRYDGNRNLVDFTDGADNTGDGQPESTLYLFDGFDRQVSVIDAIGNQSFTQYDPAGNVVRVSTFGPVGGPSPTSNEAATLTQPLTLSSFTQPLLSQTEHKYDELSRRFEQNDKLFVSAGVTNVRAPVLQDGPLGQTNDGWVTTRTEYDRKGRQTFLVEDDLGLTQMQYDGADRLSRTMDAELNQVFYAYDDDNNLVKETEIEITSRDAVVAGRAPDLQETFTTLKVYDALNRLIRMTDNLGQTRRSSYDSRGNIILASDAQHSKARGDLVIDPLGLFPAGDQDAHGMERLNKPGNTTMYFYDGLSRQIAEVVDLRLGGQGSNPIDTGNPDNPDGKITLQTVWDANNRTTAQIDDKGNTTRYRYDDLNRLVKETFADTTANLYTYDADDNQIQQVDENGSIIAVQYDGIYRRIRVDTSPAVGVTGTTQKEFQYDGLSRQVLAVDNNEPEDASDDAIVTRAYDSLGRLLEEVQNGQAVSSQWAGDSSRRVALIYPNGRQIDIGYDDLDRIHTIKNRDAEADIAVYSYLGPGRVLERFSQNGVRLSYLSDDRRQDISYDGLKRVTSHRHLRQDNSLVAGFMYSYDRENNRLAENQLHQPGAQEDYSYDSFYRLTTVTTPEEAALYLPIVFSGRIAASQGKVPEDNRDNSSDELTAAAPQSEAPDEFQLDGVGNWTSRRGSPNTINEMNEYTTFAGTPLSYDANGNLTDDGVYRYAYDAFNRLRSVTRKADDALIAIYRYDAQNRRISRVTTNSGELDDSVQYFYDGWREIEERRASETQQYVYGRGIDERLTLNRDANNDGAIDATFYYHDDARTNIVALTDGSGAVVERYAYDAYGQPRLTNAEGTSLAQSAVGNPYLFSGRRLDSETGLYYYRMRYLDPNRGRFIQRDPIGMWTDELNIGNAYTYVGNSPVNRVDPMGLQGLNCCSLQCKAMKENCENDPGPEVGDTDIPEWSSTSRACAEANSECGKCCDCEASPLLDPNACGYVGGGPTIIITGGVDRDGDGKGDGEGDGEGDRDAAAGRAKRGSVRAIDPGLDVCGKVYLCKQRADIALNIFGLSHHWLKTCVYEAGMGQLGGRRGCVPPFVRTTITEHRGRSLEPGVTCEEVEYVDEECVNRELSERAFTGTGRWSPWNQCQTVVANIIKKCTNACVSTR